ncbi:MAG TPA: DNA mismatch repair endonuclease MutL, partial [Spirochaetota bacterium]|nr:DNA mismatch repair endonuclease MutL [Spirochaetota bacterium]
MKHIHILPDSVKNKIAAGEVVEGPFSVMKELMENAIDSGARVIDVEVSGSGLKKILVRDNGDGISREDLPLTIQEHATSKISSIEDIETITTCGFRGEALSSISSISKLTLLSRTGDEEAGGRLVSEGDRVDVSDYAGPVGTTVIVENLFYNIPARKKFMKSPSSELRNLRQTFMRTALAWPEIS